MEITIDQIKKLAAVTFCRLRGINPNGLKPGDIYGVDDTLPNGDPAHFMWREYTAHPEVENLVVQLMQMIAPRKVTADELQPLQIPLNEFHFAVLQHLRDDEAAERGSSFNSIAVELGVIPNKVRLACRALKRKGLAKQVPFHDDEGYIRGSGYTITPLGLKIANAMPGEAGELS